MKLRHWQADCVDLVLHRFSTGQKHFFVLATPGSGKTVMAATAAKELFSKNQIDYVVCFAPSLSVVEGMRATFSTILNTNSRHCRFSPRTSAFECSAEFTEKAFLILSVF